MFTFACLFVHCFLRSCGMFSGSLMIPWILLPHIHLSQHKNNSRKNTTNNLSYKATTGHSKGFSVIVLVLKCPPALLGWLKTSLVSKHTMLHIASFFCALLFSSSFTEHGLPSQLQMPLCTPRKTSEKPKPIHIWSTDAARLNSDLLPQTAVTLAIN